MSICCQTEKHTKMEKKLPCTKYITRTFPKPSMAYAYMDGIKGRILAHRIRTIGGKTIINIKLIEQ